MCTYIHIYIYIHTHICGHPHYHSPGMTYALGRYILSRPYGALDIVHTGGSVVEVAVEILVLKHASRSVTDTR